MRGAGEDVEAARARVLGLEEVDDPETPLEQGLEDLAGGQPPIDRDPPDLRLGDVGLLEHPVEIARDADQQRVCGNVGVGPLDDLEGVGDHDVRAAADSPFVLGPGILTYEGRSVGAVVKGFDPAAEFAVNSLEKSLAHGSWEPLLKPAKSGPPALALGEELAKNLGLWVGDEAAMRGLFVVGGAVAWNLYLVHARGLGGAPEDIVLGDRPLLITLALWNFIPVTLTLPGIAGFLLSTGGALDANILMFERLKEELRAGRTFAQAVELGWKRAWPSIRDSNIATLITSLILFWFGSAFGATIVKGFAITLALGVAVSLFCAVMVTRTLLQTAVSFIKSTAANLKWFGL